MDTKNHSSALAFLQSSSLPMLMQEEIERLIMTGELPVGSRINESELAQRFSTSRGPIREALRALEEAGLVRNEKNRGVFVREIAFEEADEIYELREALEEIIGRRVALAIKPDAVVRLRAMLEAMRSAALAQDVEQYAHLNLQFHEILLDTAGSKKLTETYKRLVKELHLFRMRALDSGGGLGVSAVEHTHIVDAIASGDPALAGSALRQHVAGSRARMHKAFGRASPTVVENKTPSNPNQKEV
ncbi:MAG: phosphonate utilization associated transcriptional regulator [Variovorax sp.]|nr:MAG: phosphonate utilization associated transcriptional regulator [Variovorax sp.]